MTTLPDASAMYASACLARRICAVYPKPSHRAACSPAPPLSPTLPSQVAEKCKSLGAGDVEVETTNLMDDDAVDSLCEELLAVSRALPISHCRLVSSPQHSRRSHLSFKPVLHARC